MDEKLCRPYWVKKINDAWEEKNIIWLQGVRRSGKTTICKSLAGIELYDCELPRVQRLFEDPEAFFHTIASTKPLNKGGSKKNADKVAKIAIDEIHLLSNPSQVLKIAADYFPTLKVIATGSSTLQARKKFSDTLTDRKRTVLLTPMNSQDLLTFSTSVQFNDRLLRGGLPGFVLNPAHGQNGYRDWVDSYLARDIDELFNIDNKTAFKKMMELLALQSGGLFEASSFSKYCGVSAPTIQKYLDVMEQTHLVYVLRPYFKNPDKEVIRAPKVHFFDTGFITYYHGWDVLHDHEKGEAFENICVNETLSVFHSEDVYYWRDKNQNEIDLVINLRSRGTLAIECKWQAKEFSPRAIKNYREIHPDGLNWCVVSDLDRSVKKKFGLLEVEFIPYKQLLSRLEAHS